MNNGNDIYLDVRGQACPQPVIRTRKALEAISEGVVTVHLDAEASATNVSRYAASQGLAVNRQDLADGTIKLEIIKGFSCAIPTPAAAAPATAAAPAGTVVYINGRCMGRGDEQLGRLLLKAFLKTLLELEVRPQALVFVNSGVHLTCDGSPELATIRELAAAGVTILSCGTCLDFFHLQNKLAVGQVSNMYEIADLLLQAGRVVTP
ncbi:MAG: sulfurtransferase-like selenium metabolism protein YedF [Deltaproteobacteria bacterium]|nr:sulfurtransferase-like selenium metabolism protein YedF [Deltaproteobacteria bacterium]